MSEDYLAQQPTALWNPARGVWEIPMENILCEHWGLFSETFPTSGMMRDGKLFPLPLLAHHTEGSEFSLLRTPVASEAEGGAMHPDDAKAGGNTLKLGWQLLAHGGHIQPKLPTPTVSDQYTDNLASSQQSEGSMHSVTLAQIVNRPDLLPTPTVVDLGDSKTIDEWDAWTDEQRAKHGNGNGHGASLAIEAQKLLPTPNTMDMLPARTPEQKEANRHKGGYSNLRESVVNDLLPTPQLATSWGKFEPAIRQWENITGNPAPPPTIPDGKDGQHRLNPQFAEWMMGLQPGHITDCDITRNEQLKACGNGVVPQQATLAITQLMNGLTL